MSWTLFYPCATVISLLVGVIAIIVALIIARRSSKETKQQTESVYNQLDIFVTAQNLNMMETIGMIFE